MRKLFIVLLLTPFLAMAQKKNVSHVDRVFPKIDKVNQFEASLSAHAKKYHKGDWSWRVFSIESGPDAGGYQIVEGPLSWDAFDKRGDLGKEHMDDWNQNIPGNQTDKGTTGYSVFNDTLSTAKLTDYTEKIMITHVYPKLGYGSKITEHYKKVKKAWEAGNQPVAVYQSFGSGKPQYTLVYRLKGGLKELEDGFRKPFRERYEMANGAGSYDMYLEEVRTFFNESWSEILFLKAGLGSN